MLIDILVAAFTLTYSDIYVKGRIKRLKMKKIATLIFVLVLGYFLNERILEIAYSLGFSEVKKEIILVNAENIKVKCDAYAWGFFDELKLENKVQACVNDYQTQGYKVLAPIKDHQENT